MNIYVGNLSYETTENELRSEFETYGRVDVARVVMDKMTGRSRGFGFVEMSSTKEANEAIQGLNGKDADGRSMSVSEAREKPARSDNKRW